MNLKHNLSGSIEYRTWWHMIQRCNNPDHPSYAHYGARGIMVHPEWAQDPVSFIDYIGPRPSDDHSLGRKDNSKGYEPGNVRWETPDQQARNRRTNSEVRGVRPYQNGFWRVSTPRHPKTKNFYYIGRKYQSEDEGALAREEWIASNWPTYPHGDPITVW